MGRPAVLAELAGEEVHGLDAVGPFVDGGDAAVAQQLLDRVFPYVAVAAVDLDAQAADVERALGRIGLLRWESGSR